MIEYDEFGPEKVISVYDTKTGIKAIVVIDNTAMGPGKGGIRMTPSVDTEEVARLARTMTWKCALAELPFGGAKAGMLVDSKGIGPNRKKDFVQAFSKAIKVVCPELYVAAPDMYMGEQDMGWFAEANGSMKACTGKPESMGGIPHELGGTGFGVFQAAKMAARTIDIEIEKATFAVEGFGNVGKAAAKYLMEAGAKFVAVSDSRGTIHHRSGLSFEILEDLKQQGRSVINYAQYGGVDTCDRISCDHILDVEADLLITAAKPDLIKYSDVPRLRFKLIVEGSNLPISFEVENLCHKKGITVVPDFVANAGGVISSYVEYIGGDQKQMFEMIEEKVKKNTRAVLHEARRTHRMPRKCALNLAKRRVKRKAGW